MTLEKAIELAKQHFGDTYKYVSLERIKNHDYITFVCPEHGEQRQRLDGHLKHGCPWCARMKSNRKNYPLAYGYGINDVANVWNTCRKAFSVWRSMLSRCYDSKYQVKEPSYIGCTVCDEWLRFSNFLKWFEDNYIEGYQLDKDIIHKGNRVYAPEHCAFVPYEINYLLLRRQKHRGSEPIGVCFDNRNHRKNHYRACVQYKGKQCYLGFYKTKEEAFSVYKREKERIIKAIAGEYKDKIDVRVYNALMSYEVEITD